MTAALDICAYCGEPKLTGDDPPEHPIPHALGSSLAVRTVCTACNTWANVHIDQPLLRDDLMQLYRATYEVVDPRRKRPPKHPFKVGKTEKGVFVTVDDNWKAHLHPRVVQDPDDPARSSIHANSMEEAEAILAELRSKAADQGEAIEIASVNSSADPITVRREMSTRPGLWQSASAKMALGIASHVYEPEWRSSPDAQRLRELMHTDPTSNPGGCLPESMKGTPLGWLATPPEHIVTFQRQYDDSVSILIILFGEQLLASRVDTAGRPVPTRAWALDPRRPRANGETTWEGLMTNAVTRLNGPMTDDREAS